MNILIYNPAADSGGALTILTDFYNAVRNHPNRSINWHFIISTPTLHPTTNIHIHRFPKIKNSWNERLYFDYISAPNLTKKYQIQKILSLQNIPVPFQTIPQAVYLHQSLPFYEGKISIFDKWQRIYWIYKNIIGKKITSSLKKSDMVIVQSDWMREKCISENLISPDKIKVIRPTIQIDSCTRFDSESSSFRTFFYPASGAFYKNHKVILEASRLLIQRGIKNFRIIFTLSKDNHESLPIYDLTKKYGLPVSFIGQVDREYVMSTYSRSVLIFPSLLETFGLPLAEAAGVGSPIIASDRVFCREVLDSYNNITFFDPHNPSELADIMLRTIKQEIEYSMINLTNPSQDSMAQIIDEIISL